MRRLVVAAIAGTIATATPAAVRSAPGPQVAAGVDGAWQVGAWTPLELAWPEGSPRGGAAAAFSLRVAVEDPDGQFVASPPVTLEPGDDGVPRAVVPVRFGRPAARVRVESDRGLVLDGTVATAAPGPGIASTSRVALVFGDLPQAARGLRLADRERRTTTEVVAATAAGTPFVTGFDMADVILVCGAVVPSLPEPVVAGIDARVRSGGRLVLLAGTSAAGVAARETASSWLPGRLERMVPLRRVGAIETFARVTGLAEVVPPDGIEVPRLAGPVAGAVEAAAVEGSLTLPLATRRAHGFGTVTWVGVDVDAEPFRGWPGTEALLFSALEGRRGEVAEPHHAEDSPVVDLAAQLRTALERFPAPASGPRWRVVPFEVVAGVGLLYVLALYPFDWWFVSRATSRPRLAWLTLPGLAAIFTAAAAWLASGRIGTGVVEGTAAEVVDIDVESASARGSSWAAVLSGGNDRIDVSTDVTASFVTPDTASVSWFADAGRGFGGLDAPVAHPSLAAADYRYGDSLGEFLGVPIAAGATRLFEARWSGGVERGLVESTLRRTAQGTLEGGIVHRLPFALERCRLLHAGWLYDLGTLDAGAEHDCGAGRGPRSLATALTRRRAGGDREAAQHWDAASHDVARILELAGFYAAAGGRDYAAIPAGRLDRLDLSPLLTVDRGVLVGEPKPAAGSMSWRIVPHGRDAVPLEPAAPALFRIVLPVAAGAAP